MFNKELSKGSTESELELPRVLLAAIPARELGPARTKSGLRSQKTTEKTHLKGVQWVLTHWRTFKAVFQYTKILLPTPPWFPSGYGAIVEV